MAGWDPFRELNRLRREMDEIFESVAPSKAWSLSFLPGAGARQYPKVNVASTAEGYLLEALAPGVEPDTLDLQVKENILTISGEKRGPEGVSHEAFHRTERAAGKFVRTLELPGDVDGQGVKAKYTEGIIRITLPKAQAVKPRQIEVEIG